MKKETVKKFFEFLRKKEEKSSFLVDLQIGADLAPYRGMEWVEPELNLAYTEVKNLPENLTIHGDLFLTQTPIEYLPSGLKVYGELNLVDSKIKELPEDLWAEVVILSGLAHPVVIPKTPKFLNLKMGYTVGIKLPEGFSLKGYLSLVNANISSLPSGMTVGEIRIGNSGLKELPDNLTVLQNLDVYKTQVSSIPKNLKIGGNLHISGTPLLRSFVRDVYNQKHVHELSPEEKRNVALVIKQEVESKGGYVKGKIQF